VLLGTSLTVDSSWIAIEPRQQWRGFLLLLQ